MENKELNFLTAAKKYEDLKDQLSEARKALDESLIALGVNTYVQDAETLAVYKVIQPEGTFVAFRKIDYKRTAFEGEKGGQVLSKKEAEEQGFYLKRV